MGFHPFRHPFGKHSLFHGATQAIGKLAPFAGLIPGVGPLAAGGIGAIGKLISGGNPLVGAAEGAGGNLAFGKLGGFKGIGDTLAKTFENPEGGLDLGRVAGAGTGIMSLIGQRQQRKSAQARLGAEDNVRNNLISQLLTRPQYDFTPTPMGQ
jgi:hypothetical protein